MMSVQFTKRMGKVSKTEERLFENITVKDLLWSISFGDSRLTVKSSCTCKSILAGIRALLGIGRVDISSYRLCICCQFF